MDAGTSAGGTSVRQMATGAFRKSNETVINSAIAVKGLIGISPSVFNAKKVKPGQDSSASRLNTAKKSPTHSPLLPFFGPQSTPVVVANLYRIGPGWRGLHNGQPDDGTSSVLSMTES